MIKTVLAVANKAITDKTKANSGPDATSTTSVKGDDEVASWVYGTVLTTEIATKTKSTVDIASAVKSAFGIVFVGFFVSSEIL